MNKVVTSGIPEQDFLLNVGRRNGEELYWECSLILLLKDGKPHGFQGILRDVTKRELAQQEISKHQEHIKLINSILRHDIANTFAVINSALNIYKRTQDKSMLEEAAKLIKKGTSLISKMKKLEEFFSSSSVFTPQSLADIIREVAMSYFEIDVKMNGNAQVIADEALVSVFDNLFVNALKHGKASEIEITIKKNRGKCWISFADNGNGISDDIKHNIFDKAFKSGKSGNTGLGLYIVKKTIERYGGTICVEDNQPQGAKFIIELKCK